MGRSSRVVALLIMAILAAPGPALGREQGGIQVMLDGRRIPPTDAASLQCHDLDHPVIRCFRSEGRLTKAVARNTARRLRRPGGASINALPYVRVFEHAQYEGASIVFSVDYDDLSSIGWNDRITSLKVINGGSGTFWHHSDGAGISYGFCCANNIPNVGASHNDRFSSVAG